MDDQAGTGNGYVNIFKPDGTLVKRFATQGTLNSPWGITHAPAGFACNTEAILIGNFGNGRINVFTLNGHFRGQLQKHKQVITIDGLWGLSFAPTSATTIDPMRLYFSAGPKDETDGLFGYLIKK